MSVNEVVLAAGLVLASLVVATSAVGRMFLVYAVLVIVASALAVAAAGKVCLIINAPYTASEDVPLLFAVALPCLTVATVVASMLCPGTQLGKDNRATARQDRIFATEAQTAVKERVKKEMAK